MFTFEDLIHVVHYLELDEKSNTIKLLLAFQAQSMHLCNESTKITCEGKTHTESADT